jgi:hypothetical protein
MVAREFCFSTVKNDIKTCCIPESSATCESDFYELNRKLLTICGAQIDQGELCEFGGIKTQIFPRIYLAPIFAITLKVSISYYAGNED